MEDYGHKYIHKFPQFIATMNSRNNRSIDMKPNHVKNSDFMSILYSKTLREHKKFKFGIGDRVRIPKYDLLFRKGYKPQFTQEIFEIVAIATKKPSTYTIKDEQEKFIRGKFYEKELIRVIWVWIHSFTIELVSNASSELCPKNTLSLFTIFLTDYVNLGGLWEVAISEISYPSRYQNVTEGTFLFYDEKLSKTTEAYYLEPGLYSSITDNVEAMNTLIQWRNNHRDTCMTIKVSRVTRKLNMYLANEESSLAIFSTDLGHIFGGDVRNDSGILMRGKKPHELTFAYDIVRIHSLMIYTDIVEYNNVGDTKAPLLRCFPFKSKLKSGDNYWTIHELSDI